MATKYQNFKKDKNWSDKFIPEIKKIIGEHLLDVAPIDEDMERNSDLIVLGMNSVRIGCRVRRLNDDYFEQYKDQFTIRAIRPNGNKTELTKVIEGWGDYFFYGWSNEKETGFKKWMLGDLKVFRLWFNQRLWQCTQFYKDENDNIVQKEMPWIDKKNKDDSSEFKAFKINDLPEKFIIAQNNFNSGIAADYDPMRWVTD